MNFQDTLNTLIARRDLSEREAEEFLSSVVRGELTPAQIAAFLVALRVKGEAVSEIEGLLRAMRAAMLRLDAPGALDIVGTGGDGSGTFNISTAAALIAAGAGAKIAKHGNRAASSKCGSADVLDALGVHIHLTPEQAKKVFDSAGIVFMLAPVYHAALKEVIAVRKELKVRTIFNVLGPFANPAGTKRQLIGVPNPDIAKKMAKVAARLGFERLLLVSSEDGLDEVSLGARTKAYDIRGAKVSSFTIDPQKLGFKKAPVKALQGGSAEENARIIRAILDGEKGPCRDIAVLNAAYALVAAGIADTAKKGVALAEESLDSGAAKKALKRLIAESKKFAV